VKIQSYIRGYLSRKHNPKKDIQKKDFNSNELMISENEIQKQNNNGDFIKSQPEEKQEFTFKNGSKYIGILIRSMVKS